MQLRWTEEAANDLERIADYLLTHAPERAPELGACRLRRAVRSADISEPRPPRKEGGHARARALSPAYLVV